MGVSSTGGVANNYCKLQVFQHLEKITGLLCNRVLKPGMPVSMDQECKFYEFLHTDTYSVSLGLSQLVVPWIAFPVEN